MKRSLNRFAQYCVIRAADAADIGAEDYFISGTNWFNTRKHWEYTFFNKLCDLCIKLGAELDLNF